MHKQVTLEKALNLRLRARQRYLAALEVHSLPTIDRIEPISPASEFNIPFENFYPNQLWGHSSIIREEYDIREKPLNVIISHAPWFTPVVWLKELKFGAPIMVYSYYHALQIVLGAQKIGIKCPPLLMHSLPYQIVQRKRQEIFRLQTDKRSCRNGCVYFPIHSTTRWKKTFSHTPDDISRFSWLRSRYGRLSICLYYSDFFQLCEQKVLDAYVRPFDEVYCCGHRADPAFLPRLASILSRYQAVFSDEWSSVLFYGSTSCDDVLVKKYAGFQFQIKELAHPNEEKDSVEIAKKSDAIMMRFTLPVAGEEGDILMIDRHKLAGAFAPNITDSSLVQALLSEFTNRGDIALRDPFLVEPVLRVDDLGVFISE